MQKQLLIGIITLLAFGLVSCSDNTIYNSYTAIGNHEWNQDSTYTFEFQIDDTTHYYDIGCKLRIDESYRFSNLYILYKMTGPSGTSKTVQQNLTVADKKGKWLGKGYGNIHSYDFPLMKEITFKTVGTYEIEIAQYMRTSSLGGVHDVGVEVAKGDEVF